MPKTKTRTYPVVLKTIIGDAAKDNKTFALNDKQVRQRLRAAFPTHVKNTSWVANNAKEYDAIRIAFDKAYAAKNAKPARKPRAKKATPAVETETV